MFGNKQLKITTFAHYLKLYSNEKVYYGIKRFWIAM